MKKLLFTAILMIAMSAIFAQDNPIPTNIDTYPWGPINAPTSLPAVNEEYTDPNTGTVMQRIAPSNISTFRNRYSKLPAFNRSGEWIKLISGPNTGTAFVEVANPSNIVFRGVDGGGRWANNLETPNLLYVTFRYANDLSIKMQTFPEPYGSETLLHDFTDTHQQINIGNNEGDCDWNDKYMPISAQKNDGTYELIVLDLDDAKANPNQASNIYSRMPLLDGGNNIIDWVSMSPTGDYVVIAYFGNYDLNPWNGNAIVAYDNTPVTPSGYRLVNTTESHATLALDVNNEDVYIGIKDGQPGCPDHCHGEDDDTFLIMSRLRDGLTVYKFKDTGDDGLARGYYGGYITATNHDRPGYAYVIEGCCARDNAPSNDMFAIRLDYDDTNDMEYFMRMNSFRIDGTSFNYATVAPNGYEFVFNSNWHSDVLINQHAHAPAWYAKYPQNPLNIPDVDPEPELDIVVYPNPIRNIIKVSVPYDSLEVYDMVGRLVSTNNKVRKLDNGMYIVKIYIDDYIHTATIVKQ